MSDPDFAHNPPMNPELKRDRSVLLYIRDILTGSAPLNWSERLAMPEWQGITLKGSPPRVTELDLRCSRLTGRIPSEIGSLASLSNLNLEGNRLTGGIPPELGNLRNLRRLNLGGNQLTGSVPTELSGLRRLMLLNLSGNSLTGSLPPRLVKQLRESEYFRERGRQLRRESALLEALASGRADIVYDGYGNLVYDEDGYILYDYVPGSDEDHNDIENLDDEEYLIEQEDEGIREQERELADWSGWPWTDEDNYNREAPG